MFTLKPLAWRLFRAAVSRIRRRPALRRLVFRLMALCPPLERRVRALRLPSPPLARPEESLSADEARVLLDLREAIATQRRGSP